MGFVFFMVFIAPLVLLVALYSGILWVIWRHGAESSTMGQQTASSFPRAKVRVSWVSSSFVIGVSDGLPTWFSKENKLLSKFNNISDGLELCIA
uniref:Uncharacterized protein n=1 Tax=Ixodes ricinus TaxID=34613 RepID=V5H751_IXORI